MLAIIYDSAHVDFWFLIINDTQIKKNMTIQKLQKLSYFWIHKLLKCCSFWIQKLQKWTSLIYGSRNRKKGAIFGSRNRKNGWLFFWIQKSSKCCDFWIQKSSKWSTDPLWGRIKCSVHCASQILTWKKLRFVCTKYFNHELFWSDYWK